MKARRGRRSPRAARRQVARYAVRKRPGGAVAISRLTPDKLGPVGVKLFTCPCSLKDFTLEKYADKTVLRCL
jgi:hypothetical protein